MSIPKFHNLSISTAMNPLFSIMYKLHKRANFFTVGPNTSNLFVKINQYPARLTTLDILLDLLGICFANLLEYKVFISRRAVLFHKRNKNENDD